MCMYVYMHKTLLLVNYSNVHICRTINLAINHLLHAHNGVLHIRHCERVITSTCILHYYLCNVTYFYLNSVVNQQ